MYTLIIKQWTNILKAKTETEHNYNISMKSNKFQLNTVYSAPAFNLKLGKAYANAWKFFANLYDECPQYCNYPKAKLLWKEHIEKYATRAYAHFVPVKRTACYLTLSIRGKYRQRFLIRTDENGLEYIIYENAPLYAYDIDELSVDAANQKYNDIWNERDLSRRYIQALMHLEEYGYVYVAGGYGENAKRITTIEELNAAWKSQVA